MPRTGSVYPIPASPAKIGAPEPGTGSQPRQTLHAAALLRQLELLSEHTQDFVLFFDDQRRIVDANRAAAEAYGYSKAELVGLPASRICVPGNPCAVDYVLSNRGALRVESVHQRKDGSRFPVEVSAAGTDIDGHRLALSLVRDISGRKRQEAERRLLHEIDRMILRSVPLETLLSRVCRELAAIYGSSLVSISLKQPDSSVSVCAHSGDHGSYLDDLIIRCDDTPLGQGPIGRAIRLGRVAISDVETDSGFAAWRTRALEAGLRAALALPLSAHGETIGALALWWTRRSPVGTEEIGELNGFANQISLSIVEAREQAQVALQSVALESASAAVLVTDPKGIIQWVNPAFTKLTGYTTAEVIGQRPNVLKSGNHTEGFYRHLWQTLLAGQPWHGEIFNRRKDGHIYVEEMSVTPVRGRDGALTNFVAVKHDITARKNYEAEIQHLALHDPVTGLPNRRSLEENLRRSLERARDGACDVLLVIDVDNFKVVNDTAGHVAGDEVLVRLAAILQSALRPTDFMARFGGDEFAVILRDLPLEESRKAAERLRRRVEESHFRYEATHFPLTVSIGVATIEAAAGHHGLSALADTALYLAKEKGKNRVAIYDVEAAHRAGFAPSSRWAKKVSEALAEDRFVLHYQPVVRLGTSRSDHFEVLLRLRDEDGSLVSPSAFLPSAERFGLMPQVDRWVIEKVIDVLAENPVGRLFVNISGLSLGDGEFLEYLAGRISRCGIAPGRLAFEITETAAVRDLSAAHRWILRLKELGCLFALDDFGIGFSSFAYLRSLPVDYIKIDGFFVRNLDSDQTNRALVQALKSVADTLGKEVIGECVENGAVEAALADLGIELGQGFFWGTPRTALPGPDEDLFAIRN